MKLLEETNEPWLSWFNDLSVFETSNDVLVIIVNDNELYFYNNIFVINKLIPSLRKTYPNFISISILSNIPWMLLQNNKFKIKDIVINNAKKNNS